jgi:endonuclease YncB( thermonuclease family)
LDCGINIERRRILEKVRIHCIDAPELGQKPYGRWARDALKRMAGNAVAMESMDRDRFGRVVARINHSGDIGLRMVAERQAVVYGNIARTGHTTSGDGEGVGWCLEGGGLQQVVSGGS